jgi:hypothetical protein
MQTRTYGDLFKLIQSLAGVGSFADSEKDDIANFINRRFFEAFETSPSWPRYLQTAVKRDICPLVASGATSATNTGINGAYKFLGDSDGTNATKGSKVYETAQSDDTFGLYKDTAGFWKIVTNPLFIKQSDGTINVQSVGTTLFNEGDFERADNPSDVETWNVTQGGNDVLVVKATQVVPFSLTNKPTVGSFNRLHRRQSFLNNSAIEYDFFVDEIGANILNITNTEDSEAFVTYKEPFTPFSVTSSYDTSTVAVPGEFFHFIAHGAYSDFLRMDGQTDKALVEERVAGNYLALELEKIDLISNNNSTNKKFSTYVNRQAR